MRQFLPCQRCGRWTMIDLDLPADLCRRCLRALDLRPPLGERDLEVLANAEMAVDLDGVSWPAAVRNEREREREENPR